MSTSLDGLRWHMRDRRLFPAALVRVALCASVALAPVLVGIPSQHQLVTLAFFLPLLCGVGAAVSLRESVQWLRPRNHALRLFRGTVTSALDLLCVGGLIVTLDGQPERIGILAGALLAMATAMAIASLAQDFAWLGAAIVGFVCLLAFDRAIVLYIPLSAAILVYGVALLIYSLRGPRVAIRHSF